MLLPSKKPHSRDEKANPSIFKVLKNAGAAILHVFQKTATDNQSFSDSALSASEQVVTNNSYSVSLVPVKWSDMQAWPFMFSRTLSADFGTVASPAFISNAGAGRELVNACDNFRIASDAIHMKCFHPNVGDFDLIVRVINATERMLGRNSDAMLCDEVGRTVKIMEGIAFQGRLRSDQLNFTKSQLDAAHEVVEPHFREFWKRDINRPPTVITTSMTLPSPTGNTLTLHPLESANATARLSHVSSMENTSKAIVAKLPKNSQTGSFNKLAVFLAVMGVAMSGYLTYKQFKKANVKADSFAHRVDEKRNPKIFSSRSL